MRRFTRLTNGFSKKLENHVAANALYFLHYNFARIHQTLRITPAMAAGISDHVWTLEEIVWLLDNQERRREFAMWDACVQVAEYQLRSQYTHVFYLPIEFPIVPDGLRPLDPDFQKEIDERMVRLLDLHDVKHEPLTGSVEERIERLTTRVKA